jgi:hypothetical protein
MEREAEIVVPRSLSVAFAVRPWSPPRHFPK